MYLGNGERLDFTNPMNQTIISLDNTSIASDLTLNFAPYYNTFMSHLLKYEGFIPPKGTLIVQKWSDLQVIFVSTKYFSDRCNSFSNF